MPKSPAKRLATIAVVALGVVGLWGPARGQRVKSNRTPPGNKASRGLARSPGPPRPKHKHFNAGPAAYHPLAVRDDALPPRPVWDVGVDWSLQLDPDTQALYQRMADLLSGVTTVPNDRLNYYSAVNKPPDWVIERWSGLVTNVQPAAGGGYTVTVTANPHFTNMGPNLRPRRRGVV